MTYKSIVAIISLVVSMVVGMVLVSPIENEAVTSIFDSIKTQSSDEQTRSLIDEAHNCYNMASYIESWLSILKLLCKLSPLLAALAVSFAKK